MRAKANIREGYLVETFYDEAEGVIKIIPVRRRRLTIRLGRKIIVEELLDEATSP